MTRRFCVWFSILVGFVGLLSTSEVRAQNDEPEEAEFTEGATVRHKLLYRSTRFEVSPLFGMTLGDAYLHNGIAGLNLAYYLTNEIGIGISGGYGVLHPRTNLASNMEARLEASDPEQLDELTLSYVQWMAGIEFLYVPAFGKFSLMNNLIAQYDVHLIGGFTMVGRSACSAAECPSGSSGADPALSGATPAGTIGIGLRLFFEEAYAVHLQLRNHLYSRAEISAGDADPQFTNNVFLSLGFSFFLPQDVEISR
jgi:outer membrane beta-barrel protein